MSLVMKTLAVGAVLVMTAAGSAQTWTEVGDAGQTIGGGQATFGVGVFQFLSGALSDRNDVDIFALRITDESQFRAQVTSFAGNDPILWLFNPDGTLQVWNDDFNNSLLSQITSQGVTADGPYYLAISRFANSPVDAANQTLTTLDLWPGPDAQQVRGNANILAAWDNSTNPLAQGGAYEITLRGAEFFTIPTPGAAVLLGLGGLAACRRRR